MGGCDSQHRLRDWSRETLLPLLPPPPQHPREEEEIISNNLTLLAHFFHFVENLTKKIVPLVWILVNVTVNRHTKIKGDKEIFLICKKQYMSSEKCYVGLRCVSVYTIVISVFIWANTGPSSFQIDGICYTGLKTDKALKHETNSGSIYGPGKIIDVLVIWYTRL